MCCHIFSYGGLYTSCSPLLHHASHSQDFKLDFVCFMFLGISHVSFLFLFEHTEEVSNDLEMKLMHADYYCSTIFKNEKFLS